MSQEIISINIENDPGSQVLTKLVQSYSPEEQNNMLRTALVVYQTKRVSDKDEDGKKVMRKLTPFETIAHIETANALNLNPILNHLILLEWQVYITLDGHLQNAHQSGSLISLKTTLVSKEKATVEVRKWVNGDNGAKWGYKWVPQEVTQYRYKCSIEKKGTFHDTETYEAEWVADISNVAGWDANSDLKLEQMAEARAMRRCLKRAFPVGLSSFEDAQDMPDFTVGTAPMVQELPADTKPKKEEPKKEEKLTFKDQLFELLRKRGFETPETQNQYFVELGLDTTIEEITDDDMARDLLLTITPL
jgi:hypothetical protein